MAEPTPQSQFKVGVRAATPLMFGVVPFSFICGVVAVDGGLTTGQAIAMNQIIFAGASQLIVVQLLSENTPTLIVILSALVVNMRFMMYSASLAPHFEGTSLFRRASAAYPLSDQAYAVSIFRMEEGGGSAHTAWIFTGASLFVWTAWQIGAVLGVLLGGQIPDSWSLDFAVPLTFLAVVVPAIKSRAMLGAALVSGAVATLGTALPLNTGILVAAIAGIVAGGLLSKEVG